MIDRLEILVSRLRRKVSQTRWSARILGHAPVEDHHHEPGLILIQIDGLGDDVLRSALADGHLPFLKRLIQRDGYEIRSLYSGLPSSTPGFQAELFYGVPQAVPAFGYRDPELGRVLSMNDPTAAAAVQKRLEENHPGLLEGGSAWGNVFTGGASEAHLCASTVGFGAALRVLTPRRILGLVVWHGMSLLRVIGNLIAITGLVFWDLIVGRLSFRELRDELRFVPVRVALSAVMREVITAGASIDADRGLPVVQLNFLGYDEHAHRRGPDSRFARWSLKGIDRSVKRVWLAAHRSLRRDYQVWIYSDHGQETVESYDYVHGRRVSDAVKQVYARILETDRPGEGPAARPAAEALSASRFRWLDLRFPLGINKLARPRGGETEDAAEGEERPHRLTVVHQGPAGFVYLPREHDREFLERFAESLVRDGGIPAVVLPEAETATAFTATGRLALPTNADQLLGPDHPHLEGVTQDLIRMAAHSGAGELMLLGWNRERPFSLQVERGSHGGPGPRETSAFLILPPEAQAFARFPSELRPGIVREMALRTLERGPDPRAEIHELELEYVPPVPEKRDGTILVPLRVMTYNVHGCRGMDGVYAPGRISRVIAREQPDIICLQELDQDRSRSAGVDQVDLIAEKLQVEYHFHAVEELDDGRFGNAVLSLMPMRWVEAGPLPSDTRVKGPLNLWDRGAIWVAVEIWGQELQILNTHLSILSRERQQQAEALLGPDWLGHPRSRAPVILAGDFNAGPQSPTLRTLRRRLRSAVAPDRESRALHTWSGRVPMRRIDHILVSDSIEVRHAYVPRTRLSRVASDHLPLVVDLVCRFPGAASVE